MIVFFFSCNVELINLEFLCLVRIPLFSNPESLGARHFILKKVFYLKPSHKTFSVSENKNFNFYYYND